MMNAFDAAYAFVRRPDVEGGTSNNPLDRGGFTVNGFTQGLYDAWRSSKKLPRQSVALATEEEKVTIAREEFWEPCRCDALPRHLAIAVFDMAFNSSPREAKLTLQRAVGAEADGIIGEETLAAVRATPDVTLRFLERRLGYIQGVIRDRPSQIEFLGGWGKRLLWLAWKGETNGVEVPHGP